MPAQKGSRLRTHLNCLYTDAQNFDDKQELKVQGYDIVRKTKTWGDNTQLKHCHRRLNVLYALVLCAKEIFG